MSFIETHKLKRDYFTSYPENIMPDSEDVEPKTMTIGINNVFEVGCGILLLGYVFVVVMH